LAQIVQEDRAKDRDEYQRTQDVQRGEGHLKAVGLPERLVNRRFAANREPHARGGPEIIQDGQRDAYRRQDGYGLETEGHVATACRRTHD